MAKRLQLTQALLNYRGEAIRSGEAVLTLGDALLEYAEQAHFMGLSVPEQVLVDRSARAIGAALRNGGVLKVPQEEYDVLKKLSDNGMGRSPQGQEIPIFPATSLRIQVRDLVNAAEHVEA